MNNQFDLLIEQYKNVLSNKGFCDEEFKYDAINNFQENWDIDTDEFGSMIKKCLSQTNQLFHYIPKWFIEQVSERYPEEYKFCIKNLFDESIDLSQRIKNYQNDTGKILEKLRIDVADPKSNSNQDERTISTLLTLRYPEKYSFYKNSIYKDLCGFLDIKSMKTGEKLTHFLSLAESYLLRIKSDKELLEIHHNIYPKGLVA